MSEGSGSIWERQCQAEGAVREGEPLPQQPALRGVVQTWPPRSAKSPLGESETLGSSLYCGDVASAPSSPVVDL